MGDTGPQDAADPPPPSQGSIDFADAPTQPASDAPATPAASPAAAAATTPPPASPPADVDAEETAKRKRGDSSDGDDFEFHLSVPDVDEGMGDAEVERIFNDMVWGTKLAPELEEQLQDAAEKAARKSKRRRVTAQDSDAGEDDLEYDDNIKTTSEDGMDEINDLLNAGLSGRAPAGAEEDDEEDALHPGNALDDEIDEDIDDIQNKEDYRTARREAEMFFGITDSRGRQPEPDHEEEEAYRRVFQDQEKQKHRNLAGVIPPADLRRLYLRDEDTKILDTDWPERYQLQLQEVGLSPDEVQVTFFDPNKKDRSLLQHMGNYVQDVVFPDHNRPPQLVERILTLIFCWACEPVFIQIHCLDAEERDLCSHDDVWNIWNAAFEFIGIYQRRLALHESLYPVHEALAGSLYKDSRQRTRYQCPTPDEKERVIQMHTKGLEAVSHDMHNVSFMDLGKANLGEVTKWTWRPHYLTWFEKWITHWDDLFAHVSKLLSTQTAYHGDDTRQRVPQKRNDSIKYRKQFQLYAMTQRFSAHPSTIAYYLTSPSHEYIRVAMYASDDQVKEMPDADERDAVQGMRYMTVTKCGQELGPFMEEWAGSMSDWKQNEGWIGDAEKLRSTSVSMLAGSLAMEPRFKQLILNLMQGYNDQSIMALGRIRVQPSINGFGFFKQGGQTRNGYRNVCLNSRKFTLELQEEIVQYVESGLMMWWIELDDPEVIQHELEQDHQRQEAATESMSQATTQTQGGIQVNQVNQMNNKREELCDTVQKNLRIWFPSEMTFEDFKESLKQRKVDTIVKVLRTAHREPDKRYNARLPFIPFDDWFTRPGFGQHRQIEEDWNGVRVQIIQDAVRQCLDDVEEVVWNNIHQRVQDKILSESARSLRNIALRAGFHHYRIKGLGEAGDADHRHLALNEEMFNTRDEGDYIPDTTDTTLPGGYRVAGIVYDDNRKQHTVCFLDDHGNYVASFEMQHFRMRRDEEDPLVREKLNQQQQQLRLLVNTHRPAVWALGMTHASDLFVKETLNRFHYDWSRLMEDPNLAPGFLPDRLPKVEMVDSRVARVWSRSRAATNELRDVDETRRHAVGVGRTIRSPLAAVASLFTADKDCLNLSLTEMQDAVPRVTFLRRLEQQMVSIVGTVGLDINRVLNSANRSDHGLLQFLPGLGPRRAAHLLRTVARSTKTITDREDLRKEPFGLTPKVYLNSAGFVKVMLAAEGEQRHFTQFRLNLDSTRIHPIFYPVVYEITRLLQISTGRETFEFYDEILENSDSDYKVLHEQAEEMLVEAMKTDYDEKPQEAAVREVDVADVQRSMAERAAEGMGLPQLVVNDETSAGVVHDDMSITHLVKVILDEFLIGPFKIKAVNPDDSLYTLAEYRPYGPDTVFDTLVDDPTLVKGALRVITLMDTDSNGLRCRIGGCDAVQGRIPKAVTLPGLKYNDLEWDAGRNIWFPRGKQLEAVVQSVVKPHHKIMLSILPDDVNDVKRRTDKIYREMQKDMRDAATVSQTATQTADTLSQAQTLSITGDGTNTSMINSTFEEDAPRVADPMEVRETGGFDGVLNSHPQFVQIANRRDMEVKLMSLDPQTGRPLFKDGDCLMRPDMHQKSKSACIMDIKLGDIMVHDETNVCGSGPKAAVPLPAFLTVKFHIRGMHGGIRGIQVKERRTGYEKAEDNADDPDIDSEKYVVHNFEDVDHMIYDARLWKERLDHLHADPHFFKGSYRQLRGQIIKEARSRPKSTPLYFCPEHLTAEMDPVTNQPRISPHKYNPMRFYVVTSGVSKAEVKSNCVRKWMFEIKRDHYCLVTCPDKRLTNPNKELKDLKDVYSLVMSQFRVLVNAAAKESRQPGQGSGGVFHNSSRHISQASPSVPHAARMGM